MILPDKNIAEDKSLLYIGGMIISLLESPLSISNLWDKLKNKIDINSFEHYILAIDLLYIMDAIIISEGKIILRKKQ